MAESFDAYKKWLANPPEEQPPNHYRLLGVPLCEHDLDTIENAADQRMMVVRTFQSGTHSAFSQKILNEISAAKLVLLNPRAKAAYDAELKKKLAPQKPISAAPASRRTAPQAARQEFNFTPSQSARPIVAPRQKAAWQNPLVIGGIAVGPLAVIVIVVVAVTGGGGSEEVAETTKPKVRQTVVDPTPREKVTPNPPKFKPPVTQPPDENKPPPVIENTVATGQQVDLLKLIDTERYAVKGKATLDNGVVTLPNVDDVRLKIGRPPTEEYVLNIVAERKAGDGTLCLGLVVGDHQTLLSLDGWRCTASQPWFIDGKRTDAGGHRRGRIFRLGQQRVIECTVRKSGILISADGEPLIDWRGGFDRLSLDRWWGVGDVTSLFIGANESTFHISKMTLTPLGGSDSPPTVGPTLPVATGNPIDLLKLIDIERDVVSGDWKIVDSALVSPKEWADKRPHRIVLPHTVPDEYDLHIVTVPEGGGQGRTFLGIGLLLGNARAMVWFDEWHGKSYFLFDDNWTNWIKFHEGRLLTNGVPSRIVCSVRQGHLRVSCNDKTLLDWKGDFNRVRFHNGAWKVPDESKLFIGTVTGAVHKITEISLIPNKGEPELARPPVEVPAAKKLVVPDDTLQQ